MATILVCDMCDTRKGVERHSWAIDRRADAAGGMEDVTVAVDLCLKCENRLLKEALNTILGEKIMNKPARELAFGKRMWDEYRKATNRWDA